jgi:hypothetical protein
MRFVELVGKPLIKTHNEESWGLGLSKLFSPGKEVSYPGMKLWTWAGIFIPRYEIFHPERKFHVQLIECKHKNFIPTYIIMVFYIQTMVEFYTNIVQNFKPRCILVKKNLISVLRSFPTKSMKMFIAGLPDFSRYKKPTTGKIYQSTTKCTKWP